MAGVASLRFFVLTSDLTFQLIISFQSKMALCVPKIMILGHSFVRRLSGDLENHFDDRAKSNFDLEDVNVRLFGVDGRTVQKIKQYLT